MRERRTELAVLLKPASGDCDLRCAYCFYRDEMQGRERASYGRMDVQTLRSIIEKCIESSERACHFAFQGGEPTLCGLSFFEEVIRAEKEFNRRDIQITNTIQTNGMALDENWAEFLRENGFLVGISVDGLSFVHDKYRVRADGSGTYAEIEKKIAMLQRMEVPFNVLTVVTPLLAKKAERIYQDYKEKGWRYPQFIPCLDPLEGKTGKDPVRSLRPADYAIFLKDLFDCWYSDLLQGEPLSISQFDQYVGMLRGKAPLTCGMGGNCSVQYVTEADGSVYPCDFYVLDSYRLGNFRTDSIDQIDTYRKKTGFTEELRQLPKKCGMCPYYVLCRNGCRRYRDPETGQNRLCEAYREFFSYTAKRIALLAKVGYGNTI
ncbi:MAG: anaerobic sulfatase maturase [Eubacteriales bacterium]|nr:anaerobic sulfatase maturase [Eubacteriales bacterium]